MDKCKLIKRCLLTTLVLPFVALIPWDALDFTRNVYYTTITVIVASYVFLINFPSVIQMSHTRPLSFQDLEDPRYVNPIIRKRFQVAFIITLQIFGAIMITGMVDYYFYRYSQSSLSRFEIFGVVGGFISLLSKVERLAGKVLLSALNKIRMTSPNVGPSNRVQSRFRRVIRKISESLSDIPDASPMGTPKNLSTIELEPTKIPRKSKENTQRVAHISDQEISPEDIPYIEQIDDEPPTILSTITIEEDYDLKQHNNTPERSEEKKDEGPDSTGSNVSSYDFVDVENPAENPAENPNVKSYSNPMAHIFPRYYP